MTRPSIRNRLLIWTTLVIGLIMTVAGGLLYQSVKRSLYKQHDLVLEEAATVVLIEIEVKDGQVDHEWKESLDANPWKPEASLIQVWDLKTGESVRSASLGESDLEKKYGTLGERIFYDVTLPNGKPGRAVGILTLPVIEKIEGNEGFVPADHPQVFVWADSTEELLDVLAKTKRTFLIEGVVVVILLWIAIWAVIYFSSLAVQSFSVDVRSREGTEIGQPIPIPENLPSEVAGMAKKFNELLIRIDHFRRKDKDFFLNVAHEIRTPLAGVKAVIELALRKPREVDDYQRRLTEALAGTENLGRLVDRLMKFGHFRHDGKSGDRTEVDLNTFLKRIFEAFQRSAGKRGLHFEWDLCEQATLATDPEMLGIIVSNLAENAVNYAAPNTPISISSRDAGADAIEFHIRNELADPEQLPDDLTTLFDAFYRSDKARSRAGNNIGLGLSFCEEVCEVLGGRISVTRPTSHALCFTVTMPLVCSR